MLDNKNINSVLIIGAGVTGTTTAKRLSMMNFDVHLIEKQTKIGGHAGKMGCKATDKCQRCNICVADEIFRSINNLKNIHIYTSTELVELNTGNSKFYSALLKNITGNLFSIETDFIIIATGHKPYDPHENSSYGYGRVKNVITGFEAEKQLFEKNIITRITDGENPKKVAFIQCAGSRTEEIFRRSEDTGYCSTVCCSYALKIANKLKSLDNEINISVFYMDIQKFGKGFDNFFKNCKNNLNFINSRPYEVTQGPNDTIRIKYTPPVQENEDSNSVCVKDFDLLVLSVGIRPNDDAENLSNKLGIAVDQYGFFGLKGPACFSETQKQSIFAVGTCESPKDIAASIAQAEAVCCKIMTAFSNLKNRRKETSSKLINKNIIVAGGGISGLQAALQLANLNHNVSIIYRDSNPGGIVSSTPELFGYISSITNNPENEIEEYINSLLSDLKSNKKIKMYPETVIKEINGELGNFSLIINKDSKDVHLKAGFIVLASGSHDKLRLSASNSCLIDIFTLLEKIRSGHSVNKIAFILDSAHEQEINTWGQILSIVELLVKEYGSQITIYCKNVRIGATGLENLYKRVRKLGVIFFKSDKNPLIEEMNSTIIITSEDSIINSKVSKEFDFIITDNTKSDNYSKFISDKIWKFRAGPDGELQYDNIWLLPTMTNRPGIYSIGSAHGNSEYRSALIDALAVTGEIHSRSVSEEYNEENDNVVKVDEEKCVLCLTCMRICPHGAITIDTANSIANPSSLSCKLCGICTAVCPANAITLPNVNEDTALHLNRETKIVVFACENSAIPASETSHYKNKNSLSIKMVPCAGKIESTSILEALEAGAEKVIILGCHPESCHYLNGSSRAAKKVEQLSKILEKAGFDKTCISFGGIASVESGKFTEYIEGKI
jgi:heterodisulfide reductase subunit A-like polyferredoxin/coenzyme F420-reducing hydrogenase delta subunit